MMALWLLGTAVAAALLSTLMPRSRVHWVFGAVSVGGLVATLVTLPSGPGEYGLVVMAALLSLGLTAFGVGMLVARRHPRRPHRHIIYCGYGLVFAVVALCWAVEARYPGHGLLASIASVAAYAVGSLAIFLYKAWFTRGLTPGRASVEDGA
jgi:hypothetical protein